MYLWVAQGRLDEAPRHWRRLVHEYDPGEFDPQTLFSLGVALENAGHVADAASVYNTVARHHMQSPSAPRVALRLADLLARGGQREAAKSWYAYVARAWPDSREALEASSRLRALPAED